MREFLAIEIENHLKDNIQKIQDTIKDTNSCKINYVKTENIHLTLKFFGEINERKEKQIIKIVEKTINDYKHYTIKLAKIGAFPNIKRPRVIWTGIKDKHNVTINLIKELDNEFNKIGFKKERDYVPHITIGRVKEIHDKELLNETLKELKNEYVGKLEIKSLSLKESQLTPNGPIYTTKKEFKLR